MDKVMLLFAGFCSYAVSISDHLSETVVSRENLAGFRCCGLLVCMILRLHISALGDALTSLLAVWQCWVLVAIWNAGWVPASAGDQHRR